MTLLERLNQDLKEAMKAKDAARLSTLRVLISALKNKQIELRHELAETEVESVIRSQVKQLQDAAEDFTRGGRADLAANNQAEIALLETYLPAQLSEAELKEIVSAALTAANMGPGQSGPAMGVAMQAVAGRADGRRVKEIVAALLGCMVLGLTFSSPALAAASLPVTTPALLLAARVLRVFLMLGGLFAVNSILVGSFNFMIASGRNDAQGQAMKIMSSGIFSLIVVTGLFIITTAFISGLA